MSWAMTRRAAWDFETTGVDVENDRIVTAALVVRDGAETERFTWVIDPGVPCPVEASNIHGWTTERLQAEGSTPAKALEDIAGRLAGILLEGLPLVSFNGAFDYSILHFELLRHGLFTLTERLDGALPLTLIDAFVLDKALDRYRKGSRKLEAVAAHYGVALVGAHDATADALAALGVAEAIAARNPGVAGQLPAQLYRAQQLWARNQAASLQEHLRSERAGEKRDPNAVVDGSWPLKAAVS